MVVGTNVKGQQVVGTDTFYVILFGDIPHNQRKEITYTSVVWEVRPQKEDPSRTQITIGGNHICCPRDTGTNTASMELFKILINIVLS